MENPAMTIRIEANDATMEDLEQFVQHLTDTMESDAMFCSVTTPWSITIIEKEN
jgi:hypothetical protein